MSPEELEQLLTTRFSDHVASSTVAYGNVTITLDAEGYVAAARYCHEDPRLACDFFDCLIGVDERDEGFAVVANLYSTQTKARVLLRHVCAGGREKPVAPTLTPIWRGANWHEREAWDMFGIDFEGHPGLAPRILTAENFEGWPLRKDFPLATREVKPWPGAKEPGEGGHDASAAQREAQITSTTTSEGIKGQEEEGAREDTQDKAERARAKAAEMRRQKAAEREAAAGGAPAPAATPSDRGPQEAPPATAADDEAPATGEVEAAVEDIAEEAQPEALPESLREEDDAPLASPEGEGAQPAPSTADVTAEGQDEDATPAERDEAVADPAEETQSERAIRAAAESQTQDAQQPDGAPDPDAAPGEHAEDGDATGESAGGPISAPPHGDAGTTPREGDVAPEGLGREVEPPTTQAPGEAPVEGGLRETIDEQADAGEHGQTPPQLPGDDSEGPADGAKVVDLMTDASEPETPASDDALGPSGPQRSAGEDATPADTSSSPPTDQGGAPEHAVEAVPPPESPAGPGPSPATSADAPAEQQQTPTQQPGHTSAEQPIDEGSGYAGSAEGDAERVGDSEGDGDEPAAPPSDGDRS